MKNLILKCFCVVALLFAAVNLNAQGVRFLERVFDDVMVTSEIQYSLAQPIGSNDFEPLYFDLYEPVGDTMSARPMVILVFGGAFVAGNRSWCDMVAFADSLCRYGYVVASIDYRLLPILSISSTNFVRSAYAAAQDVSAAIRYFKGNADTYRIDPDQVFVMGNSAGTIASMAAIWMDDDERPEETFFDSGFLGIGGHSDLGGIHSAGDAAYLDVSPDIAGLVAQWGGVLDTNVIGSDDRTPVCLIHGTADQSVSFYSGVPYEERFLGISTLILPTVYGSYFIDKRLITKGVEHEFHIFEGEPHCFYLDGWTTLLPEKLDTCFRIALAFMAQYNTHLFVYQSVDDTEMDSCVIYPNPTSGRINLQLPETIGDFEVFFYNAQGQLLFSFANTDVFDVSDYPSGIYYVKAISSEHQFTQRLMLVK